MNILVLADTHLPDERCHLLNDILGDRLTQADLILHAGDVTGGGVLDLLGDSAPVYAVAGNNDIGLALPETTTLDVCDVRISMIHDSGSARGRPSRLQSRFPDADIVVFGHSHLPWHEVIERGGREQHHFNPGSPTQRRRAPTRTIGWIEVGRGGPIRCRHEDL